MILITQTQFWPIATELKGSSSYLIKKPTLETFTRKEKSLKLEIFIFIRWLCKDFFLNSKNNSNYWFYFYLMF